MGQLQKGSDHQSSQETKKGGGGGGSDHAPKKTKEQHKKVQWICYVTYISTCYEVYSGHQDTHMDIYGPIKKKN
jgi:hypothetical protein